MSNPAPSPAKTATLFERFTDNAHHIVAGTLFAGIPSLVLSTVAAADCMFTHVLDLTSKASFCTTLAASLAYGAYAGIRTRKKNLNKITGLTHDFSWKEQKILGLAYQEPHIDFTLPAALRTACLGLVLTSGIYSAEKILPGPKKTDHKAKQHTIVAPAPRPFAFVPH